MKKMKTRLALLMFLSGSLQAQVTDVDANNYQSLDIGGKIWTSSNLVVTKFKNGDNIPIISSKKEWGKYNKDGKPAMCYANFDANNASKYGALYNWYAVSDPRGLAPEGWHVSSKDDWKSIKVHLKSIRPPGRDIITLGIELRSDNGWPNSSENIEKTGFNALPGGFVNSKGSFANMLGTTVGDSGWWWTMDGKKGYVPAISLAGFTQEGSYNSNIAILNVGGQLKASYGLSVRCVKDN